MIILSILTGWFLSVAYRVYIDAPDLQIGEKYLRRFYLIPRNHWFNIYLHKFVGDDDDRALHDHPWNSVSMLLKGSLKEYTEADDPKYVGQEGSGGHMPKRFALYYRAATFRHRLELLQENPFVENPAWTLFVTGPTIREWGFWCRKGFVHWRDFTSGTKGNKVGVGCGED